MKNNLEELQGMRANIEDSMSNVKGKDLDFLEKTLQEISTIGKVYKTLISENRKSKMHFLIGVFLSIFGILLTIYQLLL